MRLSRLSWVGTRTTDYDATVGFFRDVLGLAVIEDSGGFTALAVPDGSTVEVFGPTSSFNPPLTTPVAGFEVDDLEAAEQELRDAGSEIVLPISGGPDLRWLHFRAPDGHLYELSEPRQGRKASDA